MPYLLAATFGIGLIVGVSSFSSAQDLNSQKVMSRAAREADLRNAGVPSWAIQCAADLLATRDALIGVTDVGTVVEENRLCSLDAEVDVLATALLALQEPEGVIKLYGEWYRADSPQLTPNNKFKRTPGAPLLLAQALRMKAWHLMDPPPGKISGEPVRDRLSLFQRANIELALAFQELNSHVASLQGEALGETLGVWIKAGPPKPMLIGQLASLRDTADRRALPAFQGVDYVQSFLLWQAIILRELGDLTFRETGTSVRFRSPDASAGASQATALGYYTRAREPLYFARLLDLENRKAAFEAQELNDRIRWILAGQAFNGVDLYQFERYTRNTYVPASLAALDEPIARLRSVKQTEATTAATQATWLGTLQQQGATRTLLDQAFKADARRQLQAQIAELTIELNKLQNGAKLEDLNRLERELGLFVQEFGNELASTQYLGELERFRLQLLSGMLDMVHGLVRLGVTTDLAREENFRSIDQFIQSLPDGGLYERSLKSAWKLGSVDSQTERTTVQILADGVQSADANRQVYVRELEAYDKRLDLARIKSELDALQDKQPIKDQEIKEAFQKFQEQKAVYLEDEKAEALKRVVVPRLHDEVGRFADRAHQAVALVKKVQEDLQRVRQAVQFILDGKKKVDEAYDSIVSVIETAKKIPKVHTAGLASGTTIDVGDAIASTAQAVLNKVVALYQGKVDTEQLNQEISKAEDRVGEFLRRAESVEDALLQKKQELDDVLKQSATLAKFQPGGEFYRQFEQRQSALQEAHNALKLEIDGKILAQKSLETGLQAVERGNLVDRAKQATYEGRAAVAKLQRALLERDQRLEAIRAHVDRLEQQRRESSVAQALIESYRTQIAGKKREVENTKEKVSEDIRKADEKLMQQLLARVEALQAELALLDKPAKRLLAADLIESLTPALALSTTRVDTAEVLQIKDTANVLLARTARWLYVLGDQSAIALAGDCRSLREFELARTALQASWDKVLRRYAATRHKVFVLSLSEDHVAETFRDGRLLIRTVATWPASNASTPPGLVPFGDAYYLKDRAVWKYDHPEMKDGRATFYLTRSAAESDGAGVLAGGWVVCRWKQADSTLVDLPSPYLIPVLFRQGPVRVRWQGIVRSLPLKCFANFGDNPLVLDDFSRAGNFQRFIAELPHAGEQYLAQPFLGQNHDHFFGVGLDNSWVFELRDRTGGAVGKLADQAALQNKQVKMAGVDIVLTYFFPTSAEDPQPGDAAPTPNLTFLNGTVASPPPIVASSLHVVDNEYETALSAEIDRQLSAILPGQALVAQPNEQASLSTADAADMILQPVVVRYRLEAAENLLKLLIASIERDYYMPLKLADEKLQALGGTVEGAELAGVANDPKEQKKPIYRIDQLMTALRKIHDEYDLLDRQVRELDAILRLLQSNVLDDAQREELDEAMKKGIPRDTWIGTLAKKMQSNSAVRQNAAAFVLDRLRDWANDDRKQ